MQSLAILALSAVLSLGAAAQQRRAEDETARQLAVVKELYAGAQYEEALATLDLITPEASTEQVEQYRALCFLALNRTEDAERALELIVRRAPLYRMTDSEVSPRLVAMFSEVRRNLLPMLAKELYARGRWNYQGGEYEAAAKDLRLLLSILADSDLANAPPDVLDLKLVAEGFLKLADAELARRPSSVSWTMPSPLVAPPPPADPPSSPPLPEGLVRIYDDEDADVKAPIELSRPMPLWTPPPGYTGGEFRGALELVIDETGSVISAVSRGPIMPNYDETLRAAARHWKYRPAMLRDGTPVRYRLLVGYLLKPVGR